MALFFFANFTPSILEGGNIMIIEMMKQNSELFGGIFWTLSWGLMVISFIFHENGTSESFWKAIGVWALATIGLLVLTFLYILARAGVRVLKEKIITFIDERRNKND